MQYCARDRTKVTNAPMPSHMIDSVVEGLEKEIISPDEMKHRTARKAAWKESSKAAMARWRASFTAQEQQQQRISNLMAPAFISAGGMLTP